MVAISVRNTIMRKFANFVRLYFPHNTTFFNEILGFYFFLKVLFGNVVFLVGICLEQKLVYKENSLLSSIRLKHEACTIHLVGHSFIVPRIASSLFSRFSCISPSRIIFHDLRKLYYGHNVFCCILGIWYHITVCRSVFHTQTYWMTKADRCISL